jgi:hypothetical protein
VRGRLNLFQVAMLRWRDLHPYNAVHVVRVAAPLALAPLQRAIDAVLEGSGLTGLAVDAERGRYEWTGGPARSTVDRVDPGADPARAVDAEIERQLNAPFPREGRIDPFRFFVVDRGAGFDLGLGYDHFIAAGDSIVALLQAILERYLATAAAAAAAMATGEGTAAAATLAAPGPASAPAGLPREHSGPAGVLAVERYPPTYGRLFRRQLIPALAGLRRVPEIVARFRRAYRPRYPHGDGKDNAFTHVRIEPASVAAMRRTAKAWGVTLNDLVLALLLQALAPMTEGRCREPRRSALAVASIVNIRSDCGDDAGSAFGQFLSSFLVAHPVPAGTSLEALARDVRADTERIKGEKLYLQTLLAMGASGIFWRFLSPRRRAHFHGKAYPVWAGTSSLHVDALWRSAPGAAAVPDYVRAIPTGPLAPMVVAVTTAGDAIVLGISYRPAAFAPTDVDRIAKSILNGIAGLT